MFKWSKYVYFFSLDCKLCFKIRNLSTVRPNSIIAKDVLKKKAPYMSHKAKLENYLTSCPERLKLKPLLPEKFLSRRKTPDHLYLVDPSIAKKVASHILPYLRRNTDQVVAESLPGLGLISEELLKNGVESIRLYEPTYEFREHLKKLNDAYPGRIQLFTKDLFRIYYYVHFDKIDNGNRIEQLLKNIPKKAWSNEPVITIIGPSVNTYFLRHLTKTIPMQTMMAAYGRVEMFLLMKPRDYLVLSADVPLDFVSMSYMTVLFNLFFDYELIEKFPKNALLPWQPVAKNMRRPKVGLIDEDKIYFVRLICKKNLPLPLDQLMPFYFFTKHFFSGRKNIIPTLESWVPGCGEDIIVPKLHHEDYYNDMNIYTEFGDLTPNQILEVFREMHAHPSYRGSPFLGMVETELIKSETIETKSNIIPTHLEKNIIEDIELNLNKS